MNPGIDGDSTVKPGEEAEISMSSADDTKLSELQNTISRLETLEAEVRDEIQNRRSNLEELVEQYAELMDVEEIDNERLEAFFEKPYKIVPKSSGESYVVVPRFVPFNVGWLHSQDEAWNTFVINKYVDWINDLPDDIRQSAGINPDFEQATVDDRDIEFADEEERDRAWDELGGKDGGLYSRKDDDKIQIQKGHEFDVIAELIERGNLPFKPQPVDEDSLREPSGEVDLRPYQERAWEKFVETGMIGVYWPPGAGKTYISLYAGDRLEGKKLIVVPSNTLKEQWRNRVDEFCRDTREWEVQTFQYITQNHLEEYQRQEFALTVFDEAHHLPANTFSKLATLKTKHRIGLSASPYREDGRTEYIFSLTGFPVGMKWRELIELGAVKEPDTNVYLYRTRRQKSSDLESVVQEQTGKVLIFCDSIDEGKRISKKLGVPFVHGQTTNRMEKFENNRVVISSRVGDEGLSLDNLDVVVEYDFHGGSRRQEAQRVGRVMHGDGEGTHILMMTDDEHQNHEKRLYSLEEQGFNINFVRRA